MWYVFRLWGLMYSWHFRALACLLRWRANARNDSYTSNFIGEKHTISTLCWSNPYGPQISLPRSQVFPSAQSRDDSPFHRERERSWNKDLNWGNYMANSASGKEPLAFICTKNQLYLTNCQFDWLIDDWLIDWLIDWLMCAWMNGWIIAERTNEWTNEPTNEWMN